MTYASVYGAGQYATLSEMAQNQLLDAALSTGVKYGYRFTVSRTLTTSTLPSNFTVLASPVSYGKTGRYSFYIDTAGEIHGADLGGQPASASDPIVDDCTTGTIAENEACTIMSVRTLHSAEMTCANTFGQGNFCSLADLATSGLISPSLQSGLLRGYRYTITLTAGAPGRPARFSISIVPVQYGVGGKRSYYLDETAVIRAADKHGEPADETDPPL